MCGERVPDRLGLLGLLEECVWVWDAPQLAHCEGQAPLDIVLWLGHEDVATWWRDERRRTLRLPRDRIETILDELARGG